MVHVLVAFTQCIIYTYNSKPPPQQANPPVFLSSILLANCTNVNCIIFITKTFTAVQNARLGLEMFTSVPNKSAPSFFFFFSFLFSFFFYVRGVPRLAQFFLLRPVKSTPNPDKDKMLTSLTCCTIMILFMNDEVLSL